MTGFNPNNFDPKTGAPKNPPTKEELFRMFRDRLLKDLQTDAYRKGDYTLSSGRKTDHYVNCKPVSLSGEGSILVGTLLLDLIDDETLVVAGLTLGADPLVAGVSLTSYGKLDAFIVRKEPKGHGTQAWIEGPPQVEGARVTILEDVITTGGSAIKAADIMRRAGYQVERVVSIVDRQEGGEHAIMNAGLELKSIFTIEDFT